MLEITLEIIKQNTEAMNALAVAIESLNQPIRAENVQVLLDPKAEDILKETTEIKEDIFAQPASIIEPMPEFVSEDKKREWLVGKLTQAKIDIPSRTRTTTLEKKWAEYVKNAEAPPESVPEPEPAIASAHSKEQVTAVLKAYVTAAKNDKDRVARRDAVRTELKKYKADNVSQLAAENYAAVITAFKE